MIFNNNNIKKIHELIEEYNSGAFNLATLKRECDEIIFQYKTEDNNQQTILNMLDKEETCKGCLQ